MPSIRRISDAAGMLEVFQIPVLQDNYIYVLHSAATQEVAVIDPAQADPVHAFLTGQGWRLSDIFNTHHHGDHVGGNLELKREYPTCHITGFADDAVRIPGISRQVEDGERLNWGGQGVEVLFLPGHTAGHIAYYLPQPKWLFCGDVLFLMGCGRLFEGTAEQMFASLQRICEFPEETLIFCAHEYTETNGRFALEVEPENTALRQRMQKVRELRQQALPTVPATLAEEKATNPFLRCTGVEAFAELRQKRNSF